MLTEHPLSATLADHGTGTIWLFNIAMENPRTKWWFLAGKIIYTWAIYTMAMLVITRGYEKVIQEKVRLSYKHHQNELGCSELHSLRFRYLIRRIRSN